MLRIGTFTRSIAIHSRDPARDSTSQPRSRSHCLSTCITRSGSAAGVVFACVEYMGAQLSGNWSMRSAKPAQTNVEWSARNVTIVVRVIG